MAVRITPQEYFMQENQYKQGIIMGAILIITGLIIGALLVYVTGKSFSR